ncbi:MAG TPA: hypothetical protein VHR72_07865, partial [Gemmataceae bacterium]|nr:hypothetical protein [Gemmataceae bacterium]
WHGIAGFHFWFNSTTDKAEHYHAFQPVCVFTKEWNGTFGPGEKVVRHLKAFNDTRFRKDISVGLGFVFDGASVKVADNEFFEPGMAKEYVHEFTTPNVRERTEIEVTLTCFEGTKELFRDTKKCFVLGPMPDVPQSATGRLAVYDPKGTVAPWLKKHGYPFAETASLDKLPARADVLIVGPDALTPRQATDPRWVAMASKGMRILVLDQAHPLHFQAVPADLTPTDYVGRIAFPENADHPAFRGLGKEDFFCWSGDHIVYRNAYKKASYGARSLLQCDDELSCTALVECPVQGGVLVLSQTAIGAKLDTDPVAQRLFANLIEHCLTYKLPAKSTVTVFAANDTRLKLIDSTGLKHTKRREVLDALGDPKADIAVVDASPANLAKIAGSPETLKKFTARGGYLMLWGLTPEGLASYDKIVGVEHAIRPFGMERVTLPAVRDSLLAGLTSRDVAQEGTEQINPWAADRYPAKDTFTYVVDLDDIAPFAKSARTGFGWGQMTNGLTSADNWKFIFYQELKADPTPKWSAEFPKAEEVTHFAIVLNAHYQVVKKMRLVFDDDPKTAVTFDLKGEPELRQEFDVPPTRCKKITMEPIEFDTRGKQPTTGVDNIWITVKNSDDYRARVVPLANMGVLVKYRMGQGGIVLNQLRVPASETNPINGPKKQNIVATLLRNLGATFAAEKLIVAGSDMDYMPIPLGDKCNAFLDSARGWFDAQHDLSHLPIGEQKLAGVEYVIRDFKTSPLPACIVLDGPGGKTKSVREVDGIPVGRKADALFFLQTFHRTKVWRPQGNQKTPPAVFKYVVRYADGKSATVPVIYGRGADDWIAESPQGLADAAVAWAAPFPNDRDRQAVAYQMMWTNPHPDAVIRSVDAVGGTGYGVPVVLAITAATSRK